MPKWRVRLGLWAGWFGLFLSVLAFVASLIFTPALIGALLALLGAAGSMYAGGKRVAILIVYFSFSTILVSPVSGWLIPPWLILLLLLLGIGLSVALYFHYIKSK